MLRGGPKQFAQFVYDTLFPLVALNSVETLYGVGNDKLMRVAPPPDSMDWVRDCLGVDFDGPTAWDRYMNLHKWEAGVVSPNLDGAPRRGYRGWLLDFISSNRENTVASKALGGPSTTNQEIFNDADMDTVYNAWHNTQSEFCLVGKNVTVAELVDTADAKLNELATTIFGSKATNHLAYILESAVCDGRCGVLGRLIEKVNRLDFIEMLN